MAERVINRETRERFGGTVKRAVLLRSDDEPGQLVVRVFVEAADDEGLAGWQRAHQAGIEEFRRELSLRLPSARLLEFTYDSLTLLATLLAALLTTGPARRGSACRTTGRWPPSSCPGARS